MTLWIIKYFIMKKIPKFLTVITLSILLSGCATIFGGPVNTHQRTKPGPGEPQREVRVVALIADIIIFAPSLIVDFATAAIYKPY